MQLDLRVEIIFCPIYNCIVDYNAQFLDIPKLKFSKRSYRVYRENHIMMKFRRKEKRNFKNES